MEATTSDYDREKLQERLAKLSGEPLAVAPATAGWGMTTIIQGDAGAPLLGQVRCLWRHVWIQWLAVHW